MDLKDLDQRMIYQEPEAKTIIYLLALKNKIHYD